MSFFILGNITEYIIETKACHAFSIAAFSIKVEENKTILTILFNNEAFHSAAISLEVLDNILFKSLSGPSASIQVFNKPQPLDYAAHKMYVYIFNLNWALIYHLTFLPYAF